MYRDILPAIDRQCPGAGFFGLLMLIEHVMEGRQYRPGCCFASKISEGLEKRDRTSAVINP